MVQETATVPETPSPLPVEVVQPPTEEAQPAPEPEPTEATPATEEPAEEVEPWESVHERLQARDEYKELIEETQTEAQRQGQLREAGQRKALYEHIDQSRAAVQRDVNALNKTLTEMIGSGQISREDFEDVFARHAPGLNAYKEFNDVALNRLTANRQAQSAATVLWNLADAAGITEDAEVTKMLGRIVSWQQQGVDSEGKPIWIPQATEEWNLDGAAPVYKKFFKVLESRLKDAGYKTGKKDGVAAAAEVAKAKEREGKGPSTAAGSAAGGRPTYQQLMAMEPDDYANVDETVKRSVIAEYTASQQKK